MLRIPIPVHHGYELVFARDILYFQADGNFSIVICNEKKYIHSILSLKNLEQILHDSGFCRIHHKYLINMEHITRYFKGDGGEVVLSNGEKLDVSRGKKENLIRELKMKLAGETLNPGF